MDILKKFGLIGYPLSNTFSVDYFTSKFEKSHQAFEYKNYPIESIELLPNLFKEQSLRGLNVTKPYKQSVIPYLDSLADSASLCGAVNCIEIGSERKRIGHNTDLFGFKKSLISFLGSAQINEALIIGNGGAARAVQIALKQLQISFKVIARNGAFDIHFKDAKLLDVSNFRLIIQTTPVGMFPNVEGNLNVDFIGIGREHFCYDLIYLPTQTQFLKVASEAGAHTMNGLQMLHLQADEAYRIWMNSET